MERSLAGFGLKLHDLGDAAQFPSIDLDSWLRDLADIGVPRDMLLPTAQRRLGGISRLLVALDDSTDRCEALLMLRYGLSDDGLFPIIDGLNAPTQRGRAIIRRLIAWLLTRFDVAPGSACGILAQSSNPDLHEALAWAAQGAPSAAIYPDQENRPVDFGRARYAARLAEAAGVKQNIHRASGTTWSDGGYAVVLDLRETSEAVLDKLGGKLFRTRLRAAEQRKPPQQPGRPTPQIHVKPSRQGAEVYWLRGA